MYNFIFENNEDYMGFFDRVRDSGISINRKTINQLDVKPTSQNFYPLWGGCDNILDKSKVELINKGKMKLLLVSDGESLQEMTLNWVMDLIKKFNIDSKQVIFMSYDLRSNDTYRLLLEETIESRRHPIKVIGMDTYLFERHSGFGDLPLPTEDKI